MPLGSSLAFAEAPPEARGPDAPRVRADLTEEIRRGLGSCVLGGSTSGAGDVCGGSVVSALAGEQFQVTRVDDLVQAWSLSAAWEELADLCSAGAFARPDYALTWWQHLGRGQLLVLAIHCNDQLVALAPLHQRRAGPLRITRWLGHGLGTVAEVLVHPDVPGAADALWSALDTRTRVLDLLETRDSGAGLVELAERGHRDGYTHRSALRDGCPTIELQPGGAEAHLAAPAHKRVRRTVRVARRRMEEAGLTWEVKVADDLDSWRTLRPAVQAVYDASEDAQPRTHLLAGDWEPFTDALLSRLFTQKRALALVGVVDGHPVCFELALLTAHTSASWIGRFAPEAAQWSPGHLLQESALDLLPLRDVRRIDLLLGEDLYKTRWATGGYKTLEITYGRRSAVALVDLLSFSARLVSERRSKHRT